MSTISFSAVPDPESVDHEPSEITYDEQFYPRLPGRLRPSARRVMRTPARLRENRLPTIDITSIG